MGLGVLAFAGVGAGDCWQFNEINALAGRASHAHFHVAVEADIIRDVHVRIARVGFRAVEAGTVGVLCHVMGCELGPALVLQRVLQGGRILGNGDLS